MEFGQPNASSLDALIIQMQSNTGLNAANVQIEKVGSNKIRFTKTDGLELNLDFTSGFGDLGFAQSTNVDSVWADLSYEADDSTPKGSITEGALWYNSDLKIEILKNVYDGNKWFGKNMHGQKTQMVFYQKNYNYVQVCQQLVKMVHHHYKRK